MIEDITVRYLESFKDKRPKEPILIEGHGAAQMAVPLLRGGKQEAPDYSTLPPRGGAYRGTLNNCIAYFNTAANGANYYQDQYGGVLM